MFSQSVYHFSLIAITIFLRKLRNLGLLEECGRILTKALGATDPKAQMLRFHTQTGGSTLTAQQPLNNVIRVTNQAMAAVLGGTQSLHTNGYDEALSLPTEAAAKIALRTQQIIAFESGVTDTVDLSGFVFCRNING